MPALNKLYLLFFLFSSSLYPMGAFDLTGSAIIRNTIRDGATATFSTLGDSARVGLTGAIAYAGGKLMYEGGRLTVRFVANKYTAEGKLRSAYAQQKRIIEKRELALSWELEAEKVGELESPEQQEQMLQASQKLLTRLKIERDRHNKTLASL